MYAIMTGSFPTWYFLGCCSQWLHVYVHLLSFFESLQFLRSGFNLRSSHTKDSEMALHASSLNPQHYKVRIQGKVEESREKSGTPLHIGVVAIEKNAFGSPSTTVTNFTDQTLAWWLECLLMAREAEFQSQFESYQILKKWYSMPPCLTLSIIK